MRMDGMIGENENSIPYSCSPRPAGVYGLSSCGTRRAVPPPDHFLDYLPFVTLTERVVDFLERYNKAIYGLG